MFSKKKSFAGVGTQEHTNCTHTLTHTRTGTHETNMKMQCRNSHTHANIFAHTYTHKSKVNMQYLQPCTHTSESICSETIRHTHDTHTHTHTHTHTRSRNENDDEAPNETATVAHIIAHIHRNTKAK